MLTVPVNSACAEKNFSILKLIKTYLRCPLNQEKLLDLALISIEQEIATIINYRNIIDDFASKKIKKKNNFIDKICIIILPFKYYTQVFLINK